MNRILLVRIHMYLAAFFTPAVLLVAISGGLYLIDIKGEVEQELIYKSDTTIDSKSISLHADVQSLLTSAGLTAYSFEYVKVSGATLYTRPTSTQHYIIKTGTDGTEVIEARPNLQSKMLELHQGHGPKMFKTFQTVFAVALIFVMLSGLWLGISAARLRTSTLLTAAAGALVFVLLL